MNGESASYCLPLVIREVIFYYDKTNESQLIYGPLDSLAVQGTMTAVKSCCDMPQTILSIFSW